MHRLLPILLALLVSLAGCGATGQTNQQLPPDSQPDTATTTLSETTAPPTTVEQNASTTETQTKTQAPSPATETQTPTSTVSTTQPAATTPQPTPTQTSTEVSTQPSNPQPAPSSGGSTGGASEESSSDSQTGSEQTTPTPTPEPTPEPEPLGRFEGPSYTNSEIDAGQHVSLDAGSLVSAHESALDSSESVTSFARHWSENDVDDRVFHAEETIEIDESRDISHLHWTDRVRSAGSTTRHFDRRVTTDSWTAYNATTVYPEKPTNYLTGKACEPYEDDSLRVPVDVPSVANSHHLTYLISELDFRQVEERQYDGVPATVYATTDPQGTLSTGSDTTIESYRAILVVSSDGLIRYSHTNVTLTRDGETVSWGETRTLRDVNETTIGIPDWTAEVTPGENC